MTDTIIEVLIAEDHPIFRKGLVEIINSNPLMTVIADLSNGMSIETVVNNCNPDIVLLDIDMPFKSGLEVAKDLKLNNSAAKVIFLTSNSSYDIFSEAISYGAKGYILKDNAIQDTVNCIKTVAEGKMYISPSLTDYLFRQNSVREESLADKLTGSELRIIKMVADHKTSKQISKELFVSIKTIENHRSNICKKLELSGANSLLKFVLLNQHLFNE
jgi:DNA-binding NarL/FixJ family response regulator